MRRSAAPSLLNPAKRPKFNTPFKSPFQAATSPITTNKDNQSTDVPLEISRQFSEKDNTAENIINPPCNASDTKSDDQPKPQFAAPKFIGQKNHLHAVSTISVNKTTNGADNSENTTPENYYSVVWCKLSTKKHKKWEGDAILITHGRSVNLLDMEGKSIGKSSGYKPSELATLKEDETLKVGGKEIMVMSKLTESQYKSGKCFVDASAPVKPKTPVTMQNSGGNTGFRNPLTASSQTDTNNTVKNTTLQVVKPRYDPTHPSSIVMPRPPQDHQYLNNRQGLQVIDVVIDPFLSAHLRQHQKEGVLFLYESVMGYKSASRHGVILADDMGLGKTLQCITLLWTLLKQGAYGGKPVLKKVLVVTPGSLVKNWLQEFKKWLGKERLLVFAVSSENRIEEYVKTTIYPVLIISYEMFVRNYDVVQKQNFDIVVCDEGHRLKNTTIKTTSLLMGLDTRRRVVLTGTPIQNDLQEFFSIVEFCNPGVLGTSAAFKRIYEDPIVASRQPRATPAQIALGEDRGNELARITKTFILRRTQEINNRYLPPKSEMVVFCKPSNLQLRLYRVLLTSKLIRGCLHGTMDGAPHLICILALKKVCNHPKLILDKCQSNHDNDENSNGLYDGLLSCFGEEFLSESLSDHSGKLMVLAELLRQIHNSSKPEKIVLVSNHTKTLDLLQSFCDSESYKCCRLDGQTPTAKRQEIVQHFNSKYSHETVFLLSSKAGGVGLNLVGASRLVLYDIDWNPANDLQAMARVWRDGQPKKVHIYRLITTGSIEEKVYQRQVSKQDLSGTLMEIRGKDNLMQFSKDDLRDLFSLNERTSCDTHDLLNCECDTTDCDNITQVTEEPSRSCQLGLHKSLNKKKENLSMDQLMDWKHLTTSSLVEHPEWLLDGCEDHISFIFWNETKAGNNGS